jgi:hypothetical protein
VLKKAKPDLNQAPAKKKIPRILFGGVYKKLGGGFGGFRTACNFFLDLLS